MPVLHDITRLPSPGVQLTVVELAMTLRLGCIGRDVLPMALPTSHTKLRCVALLASLSFIPQTSILVTRLFSPALGRGVTWPCEALRMSAPELVLVAGRGGGGALSATMVHCEGDMMWSGANAF